MSGRRGRHRRVVRAAGSPGKAPHPTDAQPGDGPGLEQTRDDTDLGWGEVPGTGGARTAADLVRLERERWEADRPPHWS